jgi:hypothetical protein
MGRLDHEALSLTLEAILLFFGLGYILLVPVELSLEILIETRKFIFIGLLSGKLILLILFHKNLCLTLLLLLQDLI